MTETSPLRGKLLLQSSEAEKSNQRLSGTLLNPNNDEPPGMLSGRLLEQPVSAKEELPPHFIFENEHGQQTVVTKVINENGKIYKVIRADVIRKDGKKLILLGHTKKDGKEETINILEDFLMNRLRGLSPDGSPYISPSGRPVWKLADEEE